MNIENTVLGLELGSTRIKAVLIDEHYTPVASGSHEWENQLVDGVWTYSMEDIHTGLQACYADLKRDVREKYSVTLTRVKAMGISGMMHGYLPFDAQGNLLCPFRTWRNTMTHDAAEALTALFGFNIPQRWSIAHLYQAMLNGEAHVKNIHHINTLAGYIHEQLTGQRVLGVGEASGMFPIDSATGQYDGTMVSKFDALIQQAGLSFTTLSVLPTPLTAGSDAGALTADGAHFLDPDGDLQSGIPLCPPEGDAGTGMAATNSVTPRTGNVSAGTSDFAMVVVDRPLGVHREIDMVTTPDGAPVAMVHCNNCTSDINAWVNLFGEFASAMGMKVDKNTLFTTLFEQALQGDADCGGLLSYNYLSGEGITDLDGGRPLFLRTPSAKLTLSNFMRTHLFSALATLKLGLDILHNEEHVAIDRLYGHGGYFKTPVVGQTVLSAAAMSPVSVMETAGEGGPYGMALLASCLVWKDAGQSLGDYLNDKVFAGAKTSTIMASDSDIAGFNAFVARYAAALPVERCAVSALEGD